jgi:hypothetical protein
MCQYIDVSAAICVFASSASSRIMPSRTMHAFLWTLFIVPLLSNALGGQNTGTCGPATGLTCTGSAFGDCCSKWNHCGSSDIHCGVGCQPEYGDCFELEDLETDTNVSPDGSCGGEDGYTCAGGAFGGCCSTYGYCGKSELHCGK